MRAGEPEGRRCQGSPQGCGSKRRRRAGKEARLLDTARGTATPALSLGLLKEASNGRPYGSVGGLAKYGMYGTVRYGKPRQPNDDLSARVPRRLQAETPTRPATRHPRQTQLSRC